MLSTTTLGDRSEVVGFFPWHAFIVVSTHNAINVDKCKYCGQRKREQKQKGEEQKIVEMAKGNFPTKGRTWNLPINSRTP